MNLFDFQFTKIDGTFYDFVKNENVKAYLVVNTASECGYTPQLKQLQELYENFDKFGIVVLAFPCNDFGGQEPGTAAEIINFCSEKYQVTFPILQKINIINEPVHPFFFAIQKEIGKSVKWNFEKFLFSNSGEFLKHYLSGVSPFDSDITTMIS